MEQLKYIIEDHTIVELLGIQNFTNENSAILELVKNAYDAQATCIHLKFTNNQLDISDNGIGMDATDIRKFWMHVGHSKKQYKTVDTNKHVRILAGSKGIGRFALSRLGSSVCIYSQKSQKSGITWETDWEKSTLIENNPNTAIGTKIIIKELRQNWTKKRIENLIVFLRKTYNDTSMKIKISHPTLETITIKPYFPEAKVGINCLAKINLLYNASSKTLITKILSDEFTNDATRYCKDQNITYQTSTNDMLLELRGKHMIDCDDDELSMLLAEIGDFSAEFYFLNQPSPVDVEKFHYKHSRLPNTMGNGIILYRNAFSISGFEGQKDWLGFGKRSRKSPAAASHPTGSWRVRENQITGQVTIDKQRNYQLKDLSNRQGLEENQHYHLFVEIILTGITAFERYRQNIIRAINKKNGQATELTTTLLFKQVMANPKMVMTLTPVQAKQLSFEMKQFHKENDREKHETENRYKYDVRILNVLATIGLKASSIAHEMHNDRNTITDNVKCIRDALNEYNLWEILNDPEHTKLKYKNIPALLKENENVSQKIVSFIDIILSEIEKKQFSPALQNITMLIEKICQTWEHDYAWIHIHLSIDPEIIFKTAEDVIQVSLDNLILNSIQQNQSMSSLQINISVQHMNDMLCFTYADDGKGLDQKYMENPRKILEVHETTRQNGHGLGMWIVNNTVNLSGGEIGEISLPPGFSIKFSIGAL